jgi:hypothetical protein
MDNEYMKQCPTFLVSGKANQNYLEFPTYSHSEWISSQKQTRAGGIDSMG